MIAGSPFEGSGIESAGPLGSGADCEFGWKDIIPAQTFLGCENLTEVTLPDTIEEIGRAVFDHCVKLEKIDLPEKLLKMGDSAFSRCESLLTIEIPETIEKIVEGTFFECKKLEKIAFSNKVTEIRENAFKDCVVLKDVYYAGTEEEWNAISINSEGNSALTNATIHFNSKFSAEDSDFNEYLYRADILSNPESPSYKGMAAYRSMPTPCDMYNIAIQGQPTLTGVMKAWRLTTGYVDLVDDPSTVLELAVEKKDMYLALLMAVLEKAGEDNKFFAAVKDSAEISKTVTTYAEQTWNIELTEANLLKDLTKEQKEELIAQISTEKEELGYLSKAVEGVEDIATFVKELDEAGRLLGMSEAMKSLVSEMHLNCPSDNADLLLALGECSKIMDATYEDLVTGKLGVSLGKKGVEITADIYWKYTKDYFFDMCPGASMLLSCYKIGKTVTNAVFKTDKTIESFYKVMAMADIENLMSVTYEDILAAYRNDRTIDNAQLLIEAMNTYFQMWNTDCVQVEKTLDVLSSVPVSSSNFDGTREQLAVIQKNYEQEHISVLKDWIFDLEEDYPNIYPKYSGLLDEFEIDKVVKALDIACPVDVLVYDSGNNLVASVINERAWANDEVTLSVMGDEKILYLYDGADYRIQTTGYDVGTMNITVMEYEDGDMIREVSYENVPVSPDLTYEMNVNDLTLEDAAYVLENVTDGKTVEHDLDTYEDRKKASVAITVKNGAMMVNNVPVTEAQLVPGERIDIVAFKSEISKFIEWQSDKNNVKFADAKSSATTFTVPDEAAAIKAVFEEDANNDISLASVSAISDQKYTGRELKPSVTVTLDGAVLVSGVDYSVAYKNNIKPGTASVTITGKGNYTGSVTKTFKIVGDPSWLYDDVPETSGWRYEAIKYVTDHGIMNGISGTRNFDPDGMLTREMFATIIYRVEGSPAAAYNGRFPDVKDPNYYVKPIAWASANGIINGHSNTGLFGVLENITREDLVVIMYRYAKTKGYNTGGGVSLSRFPDAGDTSGYAVEAMKWAVGNGIVNGRSNTGMLDPKGNAARVEAAAIIQRFMTKIK